MIRSVRCLVRVPPLDVRSRCHSGMELGFALRLADAGAVQLLLLLLLLVVMVLLMMHVHGPRPRHGVLGPLEQLL